jgi:hypothetical protein
MPVAKRRRSNWVPIAVSMATLVSVRLLLSLRELRHACPGPLDPFDHDTSQVRQQHVQPLTITHRP